MAVRNNYVAAFNSTFMTIINRLSFEFPNDDKIDRLKKKITVGIEVDIFIVIEKVGPYLEKYQTQIYEMVDNSDEKFFMIKNYEEEINNPDPSMREYGNYLIAKIKECISRLKFDEKKKYIDLVEKMLDIYIDYKVANRM